MKETYEQLLSKMGVTPEALQNARQRQSERGGYLRENLIALGEFTGEEFSKKIVDLLRISYINLKQTTIADNVIGLLEREQAEKYLAIPVELDEKHRRVSIAMADPTDMSTLDELKFIIGHTLIPLYAPEDELTEAISREYARWVDRKAVAAAWAAQAPAAPERQRNIVDVQSLQKTDSKLLQLIGQIFTLAHSRQACEIHFRPHIDGMHLCFRIDGKVSEIAHFPRSLTTPLMSRIKRMFGGEAGEHPKFFHKGYAILKLPNKQELDLAFLLYPTAPGEEVLIKFKDRSAIPALQDLAFHPNALNDLQRACQTANGVILATGTARSGVTTTLYALLQDLEQPHLNICSVEDPIECFLDRVVQGQVSQENGQTYHDYIRALLEQRPHVVMIAKAWDPEVLHDLFQLSYSSLVLSSLTAVDTASALVKAVLICQPQVVAERVRCITAQRLMRKICEACKEKVSLPDAYRAKLGLQPEDACYAGKGCEQCGGTGYKGFMPLFEVMPMTSELQHAVLESPSVQEVRNLMSKKGLVSLREDGMRKVTQGLVTVQDVLKATML